ncbi:unannotated protein [freshwater metagenome]|uniref:Unannotated protein n=1 Tax=freshwater metagenome TaxID=449393 RepID=A0A6J6CV86_9ZZZZ
MPLIICVRVGSMKDGDFAGVGLCQFPEIGDYHHGKLQTLCCMHRHNLNGITIAFHSPTHRLIHIFKTLKAIHLINEHIRCATLSIGRSVQQLHNVSEVRFLAFAFAARNKSFDNVGITTNVECPCIHTFATYKRSPFKNSFGDHVQHFIG